MDSTQLSITESTRSEQEEEDEDEDEEDEEKLEEEVKEMVNKVKKYRSTLPQQLTSSLSSLLSSQRPSISLSSTSHLMPGGESCSESPNRELTASDGDRTADDIKLLKEKILSNISAMPKVLKRMNDCISKLDRLVSSNETIHPAFKRKKS